MKNVEQYPTLLGEYLDSIRRRHKIGSRILSKRQMAMDANINESAVQQIISGRTGASPSVLKALSDRWGTPTDYREMMCLAGHYLPDALDTLEPIERLLIERHRELPGDLKAFVKEMLEEVPPPVDLLRQFKNSGLSEREQLMAAHLANMPAEDRERGARYVELAGGVDEAMGALRDLTEQLHAFGETFGRLPADRQRVLLDTLLLLLRQQRDDDPESPEESG